MTITAETNKVTYNCDGSKTEFDFTFKVFQTSDVKVVLITVATDAETTLTETTHYAITGSLSSGGKVTTVETYSSSYKLLITIDIDLDQETDLVYGGSYSSEAIETMADKLTKVAQQHDEEISRTIKFQIHSSESDVEMEDLTADKLIIVNSSGDGLEMGPTAGDIASAQTYAEAAEAAQTAAELAETNAETAETNAETAETNAETAQTAAELAETNAAASEAATALDVISTNADVVLTNADVVLTGIDVTATNADVVLTGIDVATTNADVALTNADVVSTNADVVTTTQDAIDTAADVVLAAAQAAALIGTSTTSLLIEVAAKTFTTQAAKQFDAGMFVLAVSDANSDNYMHGQVTSYSGTTLVIDVDNIGGSGTLADWTISVSGSRGAVGVSKWTDGGTYIYGTTEAGNTRLHDSGLLSLEATGGTSHPLIASNKWGFSTSFTETGSRLLVLDTGDHTKSPGIWIEKDYISNGVPAGNLTVPVGLYAAHEHTGSGTGYTHSIMGYALNNGTGNNDVVAVSGRARKKGAGVGDACGVWGSAYSDVAQDGGVMGLEGHIYQNVAGTANCDDYPSKWSVGLHILSHSTGSRATAGVLIGGDGDHRFWNGVLISKSSFNGAGVGGTIGINMASFDSSNYPQHSIKLGYGGAWNENQAHLYCTSNLKITSRYEQFYYIDEAGDGTDRYVWHGGAPAAPAEALMILTSGTGNLQLKGTLSESSLSLKREDAERKWELMDSITEAYKHHDGRYLDPALQVKSKMGWGKRPSDLTQVAIECIAELRNRVEQLEKH